MILFWPSLGWGAEPVVVAAHGAPLMGATTTLVLALSSDEGHPVEAAEPPGLVPTHGVLLTEGERIAPGMWRYGYRAPPNGTEDTLVIRHRASIWRQPLPLATLAESTLVGPGFVAGRTAQKEPITFVIRGEDLPPTDLVEVRAPEGQLGPVMAVPDGLEVSWTPGEDRFPRSVPIAVRDGRRPHQQPVWVVVRLSNTAVLRANTDPGAQVSVEVSGRRVGPVQADAKGRAVLHVDVRPGEQTGRMEMVDRAGNRSSVNVELGGVSRPSMGSLAEPGFRVGAPAPMAHLMVTAPDGRPWKGAAPSCRTSLDTPVSVVPTEGGRYMVLLPPLPAAAMAFDLRLDCDIAQSVRDSVWIPVISTNPSKLVVQAYPSTLSVDLPVSQFQAYLENAVGERLPPVGITMEAAHGEVTVGPLGPATVRGEYRGDSAAAHGGDVIRGLWSFPPGELPVWGLALRGDAEGEEGVLLEGRALDRQGHPISGTPVRLQLHQVRRTIVTDEDGWATAMFERPQTVGPWHISVDVAGISQHGLLFARHVFGPVRGPDVQGEAALDIVEGRVRKLALWTDPKRITAGGEVARVHLRLSDRAGNTVTDESFDVAVSEGVVTTFKQMDDGTFEATYAPPVNMSQGRIQLTVRGEQSNLSSTTTLEVIPRRTTFAPGVSAGILLGPPHLYAPWVGMEFDTRWQTEDSPWFTRFTAAVTNARDTVGSGYDEVEVSATYLQLGLGIVRRWERPHVATWVGGGMVVAPYRTVAQFDQALDGFGLGAPGFNLTSGYGIRLRGGELQLQASYIFVDLGEPQFGWSNLGGVATTVGYKVLY